MARYLELLAEEMVGAVLGASIESATIPLTALLAETAQARGYEARMVFGVQHGGKCARFHCWCDVSWTEDVSAPYVPDGTTLSGTMYQHKRQQRVVDIGGCAIIRLHAERDGVDLSAVPRHLAEGSVLPPGCAWVDRDSADEQEMLLVYQNIAARHAREGTDGVWDALEQATRADKGDRFVQGYFAKLRRRYVTLTHCAVCSGAAPARCTACRCEAYCGKECQVRGWKRGHRAICAARPAWCSVARAPAAMPAVPMDPMLDASAAPTSDASAAPVPDATTAMPDVPDSSS